MALRNGSIARASLESQEDSPSSLRIQAPHGGWLAIRRRVGTSTPCLLIHGFGEGGYVWEPFILGGGASIPFIDIDLCGHGDSDWLPDGRYGAIQHARDIVHVVDSLRLTQLTIVGHSLGGNIAARVAVALQSLVTALVIVDTEPDGNAEARDHVRRMLHDGLRLYRDSEEFTEYLVRTRPLAARPALERMAVSALRRESDGQFRLKLDPSLADPSHHTDDTTDIWAALRAVRCPSLIVRGALSGVFRSDSARRMEACMRDGRLVTIRCAGHNVMTDNPTAFQQVTLPFLHQFTRPTCE